ncbi:pilus assembly protein TadG-related protein [Altericroceibacterium spongiae]|uniref:pilus assembly protein TadG-related protein n=1 Tax=Altericroceibacterium spongiae TaxID=2320269 RepID=UPI001601E3E7|nr:pilus assembly protein TadG-related protein [Altericroceibacterium spongiae]
MRKIPRDCTANVAIIAALGLPAIIGSAGLALDLNRGYEQRMFNQRVADMGALAAAMAYKANPQTTLLTPSARDIVIANGLADATVTASLIEDYPSSGDQAVKVVVTKPVPFTLGNIIGFSGSYSISAESYASVTAEAPYATPCFLAISNDSGQSAIKLTGGTSIVAPGCAVAAFQKIENDSTLIRAHDIVSGYGDISLTWGTLEAESLRFGGSLDRQPYSGTINVDENKRFNQTTDLNDPWAADATLLDAEAELDSMPGIPSCSSLGFASCGSAQTYNFDYNASNGLPRCSGDSSAYCMPAGNYVIDNFNISGGIDVHFASGSNIYINNTLYHGGDLIDFGDSNVYMSHGLSVGGGSEMIIGDGDVMIGADSSDRAVYVGGGARFFMGNGEFIADGTVQSDGGSAITFGKYANNYIDGDLLLSGSALFGSGRYTIDGNFENGSGSDPWPLTDLKGKTYGQTLEGESVSGYRMAGVDVSFVISGAFDLNGSANTKLVAPARSVAGAQIADLLLFSRTAQNTVWGGGSNNNFAGVIYLPESEVTMTGGNNTTNSGQCFSLVAARILLSGGAASGTACKSMEAAKGSSGSGEVRLIG